MANWSLCGCILGIQTRRFESRRGDDICCTRGRLGKRTAHAHHSVGLVFQEIGKDVPIFVGSGSAICNNGVKTLDRAKVFALLAIDPTQPREENSTIAKLGSSLFIADAG